jgi:peptidoglycan-N-acetylglucosamine deacetylase
MSPKIMFKHTIPFFIRLITPWLTWKVKTNDKTVFLTFDDGPHPHITPWVLQQLQTYNAQATFFCVGQNAATYPSVVSQIRALGHQLGNHTYNHISGWRYSLQHYLHNIEQCAQVIPSNLFRPPYGRIHPLHIAAVKKAGYQIIMWDVLTRDYEKDLDTEKALHSILAATTQGSILVFHDSEKAELQLKTLLPLVLQNLSQQGYSFKTFASCGLQ